MPRQFCTRLLLFLILFIASPDYAQLTDFSFSVSPSNETCTGNGALTFTVGNTTPGAIFTFAIYQLPNTTTPITTTSLTTYSGLSAGNYLVVATQTLGVLSNTKQVTSQIIDQRVLLTYQLNAVPVSCTNVNLTVNVLTGTAVTYEIISGPQLYPPQTSNLFPNLGPGVYTIRANDACGEGVAQTYTVNLQNPPNLTIFSFNPSCELVECDRMKGTMVVLSNLANSSIRYPLTITATSQLGSGGTPQNYVQTIPNGNPTSTSISLQFPFFHGQNFNYQFTIVDACGNSLTSSNFVMNRSFSVNVNAVGVSCNRRISINTCNYKLPLQVEFLVAPPGFNPTDFNAGHPGPFATSTIQYAPSGSNALPSGNYTIKVTDACGHSDTKSLNLVPSQPNTSANPTVQNCNLMYNYTIPGNAGGLAEVIVINAPPTYSPNLPLNITGQITGGNLAIVIPPGSYTFQVTDSCGNFFTISESLPVINGSIEATVYNLIGCGSSGQGTIRFDAVGAVMASITMTSAPSYYSGTLPQNFNSSILMPNGIVAFLSNIPMGTYEFTIEDTCGNTYLKTVTLSSMFSQAPSVFQFLSGCGNFGSFKMVTPNSGYSSAQITSAPSSFSYPLPYNLASNIDPVSGDVYINSLPAGNYTISSQDNCGVQRQENFTIEGYSYTDATQVIPQCNSFSLQVNFTDNNTSTHRYWLQKWNPQTNEWVHPLTNFVYLLGSLYSPINAVQLQYGINNNLAFEGHFRIIVVYEIYGVDENSNEKCSFVFKEFDYSDEVSIENAFLLNCSGSGNQVYIEANGVPPLHYFITAFNGNPLSVDNGTNNIFTGLSQGLYNFMVQDNCGNIVNRDFDIGLLEQPSISSQNLCEGQIGQLSVTATSFYTYQWWNAANPSEILSTSNVLTFAPFSNATTPGTYVVQLTTALPITCAAIQLTYVIGPNITPEAGIGKTLEYCSAVQSIDLFSALEGNYSTNGVWTTSSVGGILTDNVWNATNAPYGTYTFLYHVTGQCGAFDETEVVIVLREPLPPLQVSSPVTVCEGDTVQLSSTSISNASYLWTGPNGFSASSEEVVFQDCTLAQSGNYTLVVSRDGCQETIDILLNVNPKPEFSVVQGCYGGRYKLEIVPNAGSFDPLTVTYNWSGPSGFNANTNPVQLTQEPGGSYQVTVMNPEGCSTTQIVQVLTTQCEIPTVITPNQDGANDSFDLTGFLVNRLEVFNRWGRKVYEQSQYTNEWQGQNQHGESLPDGVYYYFIDLQDGQTKRGWVMLTRGR